MKRKLSFWSIVGAMLAMCCYVALAQQPADPSKSPQQIGIEYQNAYMKAEIDQQNIRNQQDVNSCQQVLIKANTDWKADADKMEKAETDGLKALGLDPAKYTIQPGTFFVAEKTPTTKTAEKKP